MPKRGRDNGWSGYIRGTNDYLFPSKMVKVLEWVYTYSDPLSTGTTLVNQAAGLELNNAFSPRSDIITQDVPWGYKLFGNPVTAANGRYLSYRVLKAEWKIDIISMTTPGTTKYIFVEVDNTHNRS